MFILFSKMEVLSYYNHLNFKFDFEYNKMKAKYMPSVYKANVIPNFVAEFAFDPGDAFS